MAQSKNSFLSALASSVTSSGTVPSAALAPEVTSSIEGAGTAVYDSASLLPIVGNTAGDTAFVKSTSRLYIHSGVGWYNVAVINNTPTVQSITDSDGGTTPFTLATDGTPTTITITAQDSDGEALTYNYSADSGFAGLATLSQDANVFTITPYSQDSATTTSGTITFSVTDGINTATPGAQTFTLSFLSALWDETVLSIGTSSTNSLDNDTFIDRSTNAYTVTATGSPVQTAFHPYLDNWSVEFDGAETIGYDPTGIDLTSNKNVTVEMWVNLSDNSGIRCFFDIAECQPFRIVYASGLLLVQATSSGTSILSGSITLNPSTWYHIVMVRKNDDLSLFVNGTRLATTTYTSNWVAVSANNKIWVGCNRGNTWFTAGSISNLRFTNTSVYDPTLTSISSSTSKLTEVTGTLLLSCGSNNFRDQSSNSRDITSTIGTPKISSFNPFGQLSEYAPGENKGSTYFNGSSNITVDDESAAGSIYPADNDWTISCWFYNTGGTGAGSIFTWGASGIYSPMNIYADQTNLLLNAPLSTGGSWNIAPDTNVTGSNWVRNTWNHVELCRDGSDFHLFLNGSLIRTVTSSSTLMTPTQDITIGKRPTDTPFTGYISDMQYILGTALHTSDFTPPTSPVTHVNSAMYLPMDNAGIYDKTGNSKIAGSLSTSITQAKFADTSIYLNGSQKLYITDHNVDFAASTPFTVEFWLYGTGAGGIISWTGLIDQLDTTLYISVAGNLSLYSGGDITPNSGGALTGSQWNHIAMVRGSDNYVRLYVNGTLYNTSSSTYTSRLYKTYIEIGGYANTYFTGYIENLQMLPGVAKYTTNFTPPTQTQGRTYQATS